MKMPFRVGAHAFGRAFVDGEIAVGKRDAGGAQLLGERHVGRAAGGRGDERIGAGGAQLGDDRRPVAAVHRQIFLADDLAALSSRYRRG